MKVEEPVKIGSFILKNRMTFAPTVKFDFAGADGKVQDISVDHYRERAEGGCALICVESNAAKALDQMQQQLAEANALVAQLQASLDKKKAQFIEKQQEVQSIKGEIKQLDQALNRSASEIEAEIEQNKNRYIDCLNEEATIKNDLKHIEQQLIMQQESAEKMTDRSQEMNKELAEITKQLEVITTQLQ